MRLPFLDLCQGHHEENHIFSWFPEKKDRPILHFQSPKREKTKQQKTKRRTKTDPSSSKRPRSSAALFAVPGPVPGSAGAWPRSPPMAGPWRSLADGETQNKARWGVCWGQFPGYVCNVTPPLEIVPSKEGPADWFLCSIGGGGGACKEGATLPLSSPKES